MISRTSNSAAVMRRRSAVVAMALMAAGTLLPASGAFAHSVGHYVTRPNRALRFRVRGTHGFSIGVSQASRRHFEVTVRRGPVRVEYVAEGPRTHPENQLRGRIGRLGNFNVRFTPKGKVRKVPPYSFCTGPNRTIQRGTVHGTIRFRGERGYTRALARRASAEVETTPSLRCRVGEPGHSKHPPQYTATLSVEGESGSPGSFFEALRFAPDSPHHANRTFYEASAYETRGSIRINRQIRLSAPAPTFALPNFTTAPENAVVAPPAPFTGSGTFARTPESTFTWTGDLAVGFPGIDPVPLAGAALRLHYCALRSCIDQESAAEREELPR